MIGVDPRRDRSDQRIVVAPGDRARVMGWNFIFLKSRRAGIAGSGLGIGGTVRIGLEIRAGGVRPVESAASVGQIEERSQTGGTNRIGETHDGRHTVAFPT